MPMDGMTGKKTVKMMTPKCKNKKALPKTYKGKSTRLGFGGRSAMLRDTLIKKGLPEKEINGIIGKRARAMQTAPGQKNYHGGLKKKVKGALKLKR